MLLHNHDLAGKYEKVFTIFSYLLVVSVFSFQFLPYLLFKENMIVTIHDFFDMHLPLVKSFRDNNLFFKFDTPTKGLNEMSTLYYFAGFSFQVLLYHIFKDFPAYALNYILTTLIGFASMHILLRKVFKIPSWLSMAASLCFSILPQAPQLRIMVETLPFITFVFIHFAKNSKFTRKSLLLILYPFFSGFAFIGIFILGLWIFSTFILVLKDKRINLNLIIGFVCLTIGYIIADYKLFYVMFILKTPLNRSIFNSSIQNIFPLFKSYLENGYYHAATLQMPYILPLTMLIALFIIIKRLFLKEGKTKNLLSFLQNRINQLLVHEKIFFSLALIIICFYFIAAVYDSRVLENFIRENIPILAGFNFGRMWVFNCVVWYIIFALCLYNIIFYTTDISISISFNVNYYEKFSIPLPLSKLLVLVLIVLQVKNIAITKLPAYNDSRDNWAHYYHTLKGIDDSAANYISYNEFLAPELFAEIKTDIDYRDEKVVAFGYHPSVLMYNGFNCIDGYNNVYPLSYMQKFRTLIAPELEINKEAQEYYDGWGGRMYLYNSELSYQPTRNKHTVPVKLNIDMNVFKNDFGGKYILSRAVISNSDLLGLDFVKRYDRNDSIYTIYLYAVN